MQPGQYPTAGDARVFINEHWVDDTLRCDVDVQHRKIPLYGYHQKYYADMAAGKVIVTGSLMIHFRFPGYLMYAIGKTLGRKALEVYDQDEALRAQLRSPVDRIRGQKSGAEYPPPPNNRSHAHLVDLINELRQESVTARIERLTRATTDGEFDRISDTLDALYGNAERVNSTGDIGDALYADPVEMSPEDFSGGSAGFNIDIVYNRAQDTWGRGYKIRERVRGVHLTGRRKVLNASTTSGDLGSSGSSLVEIYPFVARNVERIVESYEGRIVQELSSNDTGIHSQIGSQYERYDVDPFGRTHGNPSIAT